MRTVILPRHIDLGFFCGCDECKKPSRGNSNQPLKKKAAPPLHIPKQPTTRREDPKKEVVHEERKEAPKNETTEPKPLKHKEKRKFVPRPSFLETTIEINLKESLLKKNVLLLIGSSNTGKTSIIKRLAYVLKKEILEIDDLDYDQETNILEKNIISFPIFSINRLVVMDIVDFWPQKLIAAILKNVNSKKKFNSPIIITCQNPSLASVKRITNACKKSKNARCLTLYNKNPKRKTDLFLSDMEIAKKIFRGEKVRSDSDFVQSIVQWNYLKTIEDDLNKISHIAELFSTIDAFNTNFSTKEFGFSCLDSISSQYQKHPKKYFFPNFKFLQKGAFKTKQ